MQYNNSAELPCEDNAEKLCLDDVGVENKKVGVVGAGATFYVGKKTNTQNNLLMNNLMEFYKNKEHLLRIMKIINGETKISLRIIDWFVTNYAKKNYTVYPIYLGENDYVRFKVYNDYKLKLKAYSKKRLDPFCRWERITIPVDENQYMETTIGQLNFFKWAIENLILDYIENNYKEIEDDMNSRNNISLKRVQCGGGGANLGENGEVLLSPMPMNKTRKKREELSINAVKTIKKEMVKIIVKFN